MKILITGCNGQLGIELSRQLQDIKHNEIIKMDKNNLDISDFEVVNNKIQDINPDIIINCAAFTAVDLCEQEVELAYKINSLGARNLAIVAEKISAKLIHISTDYVFDGDTDDFYREDSYTNPKSIYGKSKLMGEKYVQQFCSKYFIIRTAWLYGDGKNFVKTMINISKKTKDIRVVNDQIGTPTSTVDLAKVIIALIKTEYYGIYHATCEGYCSWYDFAKKIFEIKKIDINVIPVASSEYKAVAKRPANSVLDNFMLELVNLNTMRKWEDALEDYLKGEI
ncbi:dTDP-4-dehydrorhamnose reductase [uncultured Clostridium sp.]|nr:dTDP-4-dehydrorhamnose reductase [uncultured Clostridium sp.]SCJ15602.1 dTDP-4-dehydrorhamnose reductase [uncultured Clostridium sp.]